MTWLTLGGPWQRMGGTFTPMSYTAAMVGKLKPMYRILKAFLIQLSNSYVPLPDGLQLINIGQTQENRLIAAYRFGTGSRKILLTFGIHGNEVGTVKLAHHVVNMLARGQVPKAHTVYIVPCLNPDGFALAQKNPDFANGGAIGRLNASGVDLNRNFATPSFVSRATWSYGKGYSLSRPVFAGAKPFSEIESRSIEQFILKHGIQTWCSFHNAGSDVMASSDKTAQKIAKVFAGIGKLTFLKEAEWRRLEQTGTPKEWCEMHHIAYIEVEGSSRWASDWTRLRPAIEQLIANAN